ncbi:MAG: winged helix-turn-helix transcriptional regulator [Bdellovibrionales bacterium]|nr:winged helix-turn-helix transcriptional regulator [Bdellovibrionales bacterium]
MTNKNILPSSRELYDRLAEVSSAFSHPIRLQILELLELKSHNCSEILEVIKIPKPNLSQHLNVLKRAKIVDSKKDGLFQIYYIDNPEIWNSYKVLKDTLLKTNPSIGVTTP